MTNNTGNSVSSTLNLTNLEDNAIEDLSSLSIQYPYSSFIQFLFTSRLKAKNNPDFKDIATKTGLFFPNSPWYEFILDKRTSLVDLSSSKQQSRVHLKVDQSADMKANDLNLAVEPYHTIDYFASQGIKIGQGDDKDELGKKVKSFTAWLKTMKRMQPEADTQVTNHHQFQADLPVSDASGEETILTEAMAEVYLKQGLSSKAIEIYQKLSLQNPDNSHIFADKISAIKENKL